MSALDRLRWLGLSFAVLAADQASKLIVESATESGWSHAVIPGMPSTPRKYDGGTWPTLSLVRSRALAIP